jgi:predicted RNA binding protein YcfA (HicA-like mRNA interferase family)
MPTKVREIIKRLQSEGWILDRIRGDHRQFVHPRKPGTVTVAGAPSSDWHPKTLKSILNQAGLEDK